MGEQRQAGRIPVPIQPPRPRRRSVIRPHLFSDADDILHVTAVETHTLATQEITIRDSQNLDRETVSRLRQEAEESRRRGPARSQRLQRRGWLQEFLKRSYPAIPALTARDRRSLILAEVTENAAKSLRIALSGEDEEAVEQAATRLEDAWNRLGLALPPRMPPWEKDPSSESAPKTTKGASGAEMVACGHCGASFPPGFAFCGKCGMPLKKENCSKCGAAFVEGFAFCGKCARRWSDREQPGRLKS